MEPPCGRRASGNGTSGFINAKFKARVTVPGLHRQPAREGQARRSSRGSTTTRAPVDSILGEHSHTFPVSTFVGSITLTWKAVGGKMNTTTVGYSSHDARSDGWKLPAAGGSSNVSGSYAGTGTSSAYIAISAPPSLPSMCSREGEGQVRGDLPHHALTRCDASLARGESSGRGTSSGASGLPSMTATPMSLRPWRNAPGSSTPQNERWSGSSGSRYAPERPATTPLTVTASGASARRRRGSCPRCTSTARGVRRGSTDRKRAGSSSVTGGACRDGPRERLGRRGPAARRTGRPGRAVPRTGPLSADGVPLSDLREAVRSRDADVTGAIRLGHVVVPVEHPERPVGRAGSPSSDLPSTGHGRLHPEMVGDRGQQVDGLRRAVVDRSAGSAAAP